MKYEYELMTTDNAHFYIGERMTSAEMAATFCTLIGLLAADKINGLDMIQDLLDANPNNRNFVSDATQKFMDVIKKAGEDREKAGRSNRKKYYEQN